MLDEQLEAKFRDLLAEYCKAIKWLREKLKEKEDENRRLNLIILKMTETEEEPDGYDP